MTAFGIEGGPAEAPQAKPRRQAADYEKRTLAMTSVVAIGPGLKDSRISGVSFLPPEDFDSPTRPLPALLRHSAAAGLAGVWRAQPALKHPNSIHSPHAACS